MNKETFELRIDAMQNRLITTARSMLPADDCEDAVQSAILSAWEHLPQLREESAFDAWLMRILINKCRQIQRDKLKKRNLIDALTPSSDTQAQDEIGLHEALDHLRTEEKELLLRHHDQGYSISEMSSMYGQSEGVLKMRLYRARKHLRIVLISLLLLLLLAAAAVGTGLLDVNWFLENRRATDQTLYNTDPQSVFSISYDGRLLRPEISDAIWDLDELKLMFTYSLSGTKPDTLTVHSGNVGVDGERHDHIWLDGQILPVLEWANGKQVYLYALDGWTVDGFYPTSSEDYLADGHGEAFFCELRLNRLTPERFEALTAESGLLSLTCSIFVIDYATHEMLEQGMLMLNVAAPDSNAWRVAYEVASSQSPND